MGSPSISDTVPRPQAYGSWGRRTRRGDRSRCRSKSPRRTTPQRGCWPCRDVEGPGHSAQWLNLHDQDVGGAHRGDFQRVRPEANQFIGGERDIDPLLQLDHFLQALDWLLDVLQVESGVGGETGGGSLEVPGRVHVDADLALRPDRGPDRGESGFLILPIVCPGSPTLTLAVPAPDSRTRRAATSGATAARSH